MTDRVADIIRAAVVSGEYEPGQKLREVELSRSLGVSNSVIREAFHILQGEGVVTADPYRGRSVFSLEGLEGSQQPWTRLYDFAPRDTSAPTSRHRPVYLRDLTGDHKQDLVIGQYTGGERCCTTVTVVELSEQGVRVVGRLAGLAGLPLEGLEIRRLDRGASWELIAHRPYPPVCGPPGSEADSASIYAYSAGIPDVPGTYTESTGRYSGYLEEVLHRNLSRWAKNRDRSLALLETVALEYAALGRQQEGEAFFASNLIPFTPQIEPAGIDPNVCEARFENLAEEVATTAPPATPAVLVKAP